MLSVQDDNDSTVTCPHCIQHNFAGDIGFCSGGEIHFSKLNTGEFGSKSNTIYMYPETLLLQETYPTPMIDSI
jgi:hypothetical protein